MKFINKDSETAASASEEEVKTSPASKEDLNPESEERVTKVKPRVLDFD